MYKYRALTDWKFLLDIFLNNRLFASDFESLNDPMEGRYFFENDALTEEFRNAVLNRKRQWRICSLSRRSDVPLMWTHYAGGHNGIAIGLELPKQSSGPEMREVNYVDNLDLEKQPDTDSTAKWILSRKLSYWAYEDECRVLTTHSFVPIEIKRVLLGCNVSIQDEDLLTGLITKLSRHVSVERYDSDAMAVL